MKKWKQSTFSTLKNSETQTKVHKVEVSHLGNILKYLFLSLGLSEAHYSLGKGQNN